MVRWVCPCHAMTSMFSTDVRSLERINTLFPQIQKPSAVALIILSYLLYRTDQRGPGGAVGVSMSCKDKHVQTCTAYRRRRTVRHATYFYVLIISNFLKLKSFIFPPIFKRSWVRKKATKLSFFFMKIGAKKQVSLLRFAAQCSVFPDRSSSIFSFLPL